MTIWNPDELGTGFTPSEDLINDGAPYLITAASLGQNNFGKDELSLSLEDDDGTEILHRINLSAVKTSKWGRWLRSLQDVGITISGPDDLIGLRFTAKKTVERDSFKDRNAESPTYGQMVEKDVTYITVASINGATPAQAAAAADDPALIEKLLGLCDGQMFSAILPAVVNDPDLESLKQQVSDKSLLNRLVSEGQLRLEGKVYHKVD